METSIKIKGMSCQHCVMGVTKAINSVQGTKDVKVNLEKGEATFSHEAPIDVQEVTQKIVKAGFEVG
ncbi:MAG: heavy-metal-associated domain-containing protein [Desulfomonilaceae bacterium]